MPLDHDYIREQFEHLATKLGLRSWAIVAFDAEGSEFTSTRTPTDLDVRGIEAAYKEWYDETHEDDGTVYEADWEDEGEEWQE